MHKFWHHYGISERQPHFTYDENNNAITNGSSTSGFAHYGYYLYSDTLLWANEGWIDYLVPQSYWAFDHDTARFADVMDWWDYICLIKQ